MTPAAISALLETRAFALCARIVTTFMFWGAGLGKLIDYRGTLAEMAVFGLNPPGIFAPAVIATLLLGSALIIVNRLAWLGCGVLAVFVALTIPIAHPFWKMAEPDATAHFHVFTEHVTVIGALMLTAVLCHRLEHRR